MKKNSEEGGIACGICSISLQQASLGFGIADVAHGIVGVAVVMSMIVKKENDQLQGVPEKKDRITGYTTFVQGRPLWLLHLVLGSFTLQIFLGMILCLGASNRSSRLCILWTIVSFLASPLTPMAYCLLGLGRLYEWITVGEWICKMDKEDLELRSGRMIKKKKDDIYIGNDNDDDNEDIINFEK